MGYDTPSGRELRDGIWDIPLLARYKFAGEVVRPYLGAGWTYRRLTDALRFSSTTNGFVAAAGFRLTAAALKVSPEFRYTHWANEDIQPGFGTMKNQAEILVGFTFRRRQVRYTEGSPARDP